MIVRGEKEYRFAINKAVIQYFFLRMQKGRHKVEKKELLRSFKDYLSTGCIKMKWSKLLGKEGPTFLFKSGCQVAPGGLEI